MLEPNMVAAKCYYCQYFSDGLFMLEENGLLIVGKNVRFFCYYYLGFTAVLLIVSISTHGTQTDGIFRSVFTYRNSKCDIIERKSLHTTYHTLILTFIKC